MRTGEQRGRSRGRAGPGEQSLTWASFPGTPAGGRSSPPGLSARALHRRPRQPLLPGHSGPGAPAPAAGPLGTPARLDSQQLRLRGERTLCSGRREPFPSWPQPRPFPGLSGAQGRGGAFRGAMRRTPSPLGPPLRPLGPPAGACAPGADRLCTSGFSLRPAEVSPHAPRPGPLAADVVSMCARVGTCGHMCIYVR